MLGQVNPRPNVPQSSDANTGEFNGILEVNGSCDVRSPVPLPIARLVLVASFYAINQGLVTTRSILVAQRRIHQKGIGVVDLLQGMTNSTGSPRTLDRAGMNDGRRSCLKRSAVFNPI